MQGSPSAVAPSSPTKVFVNAVVDKLISVDDVNYEFQVGHVDFVLLSATRQISVLYVWCLHSSWFLGAASIFL
jgi:hypothetical protein